jgi:hypothetical protein
MRFRQIDNIFKKEDDYTDTVTTQWNTLWAPFVGPRDQWPYDQKMLLVKGVVDTKTVVEMSVTILYTVDFAEYLGVYHKYGLQLVAAFIIQVLNFIF